MFKVNNKNTRTTSFSIVSFGNFEQVNVSWEVDKMYEPLSRKACGEESIFEEESTHPAFTCSKLTMEKVEQGM